MTKEEAAEIVLAGPQWHDCHRCSGKGLDEAVEVILEGRLKVLGNEGKEVVQAQIRCKTCHGLGLLLNTKWHTARTLLELPLEAVRMPRPKAIPTIVPKRLHYINRVYIPKRHEGEFVRERSLRDANPGPVTWCLYEDVDKHR